MNERNFHIFYRMLAPGRAVENHEDSKGGEKTEKVVTELMTTAKGEFGPAECLLFDEVLLTDWLITVLSQSRLFANKCILSRTRHLAVLLHRLSRLLRLTGREENDGVTPS